MFKDLTRGGQVLMHSIRMFSQILKKLIILSAIFYLIIVVYQIYKKTESYQWYLLTNYNIALVKFGLIGNNAKILLSDLDGNSSIINARQFVNNPLLKQQLANLYAIVGNILGSSLKFTGLFLFSLMLILSRTGRSQKTEQGVRGSTFLVAKKLKKFLAKHNQASDLTIAEVPLVKDSETKHILITGTTGSGKSVCMMELMDHIRRRQEKAIVYDDSGTFIQYYYDKNRDVILNPLDVRCPAWNIWQEADDLAGFEAIASSLMPIHLAGNEPFWINSARAVFATLAEKLRTSKETTTQALLQPIFSGDLKLLNKLLRGTVVETLVSEAVDKMALSIKSTLVTYCKALMYLKAEENEPLFSIKRWLQHDDGNSWMFIASNTEKLEALKPLISVWLDLAARSILSLQPSYKRRIWLLIDELASLHQLNSLPLLLAQSRKFGGCVVTTFQDIHQLRAIYGKDESEAMLSMYNTNLCYRAKSPDTARWMSRLTGQRETLEQREGFSYGANAAKDGITINQERLKESLIIESEFLNLNDFEAYLVLPGNMPITKVALAPKTRENQAEAFVSREIEKRSIINNNATTSGNNNPTEATTKDPSLQARNKQPKAKEVGFNQC